MSLQNEHHVWCNDFHSNRKGCIECTRLFKKYPDVRWDNVHEKAQQYFGGKYGTQQVRTHS